GGGGGGGGRRHEVHHQGGGGGRPARAPRAAGGGGHVHRVHGGRVHRDGRHHPVARHRHQGGHAGRVDGHRVAAVVPPVRLDRGGREEHQGPSRCPHKAHEPPSFS